MGPCLGMLPGSGTSRISQPVFRVRPSVPEPLCWRTGRTNPKPFAD
jgi:hypothetical protein